MGSVILCLVLLAVLPNPRGSRHSSYSILPESLAGEDSPTSQNIDRKTSSKSLSVNGIMSALSNRNTLLVVPVFLMGIFRYATLNMLIQYASVRFGLKISTGATFYTETAVVNIFLFLLIVPRITTHIRLMYNISPERIDLVLVRTSVVLLATGCLVIGLAQTIAFLPVGM